MVRKGVIHHDPRDAVQVFQGVIHHARTHGFHSEGQ